MVHLLEFEFEVVFGEEGGNMGDLQCWTWE